MGIGNGTIWALLAASDNLGEPKPLWNERSTILGVVISFQALSVICILVRLYTRLVILKLPGWDDLFISLFLISGVSGSVIICRLTDMGLGQHAMTLKPAMLGQFRHLVYFANGTYSCSTAFMKLSLLFQYLRIFAKGTRLRKITIGAIVVVSLWGVIWAVMAWVPCWPLETLWLDRFRSRGRCWGYFSESALSLTIAYESHSATNMVLDMVVLAIPVPLYWAPSTVGNTSHAGLVGLLSMGFVVNAIAAWRLVTIVEHKGATYPTYDPTWYAPSTIVLSCLEVDFASILASIPIFWPVVSSAFNRIYVTREVTIVHHERASALWPADRRECDHNGEERARLPMGGGLPSCPSPCTCCHVSDDDRTELCRIPACSRRNWRAGSEMSGTTVVDHKDLEANSDFNDSAATTITHHVPRHRNQQQEDASQRSLRHYQDPFILATVDPFFQQNRSRVQTRITADGHGNANKEDKASQVGWM